MNTRGRCIAVVIVVLGAVGVLASAAPDKGAVAAAVAEGHSGYAEAAQLLSPRQRKHFAYLSLWPEDRLGRLSTWLEHGIRFEGRWESHELADVVSILDHFGETLGEERFVRLLELAVTARSDADREHLRIVRESGTELPAAAWYARSSRIVLQDALWDDMFIHDNYSWSFLASEYTQASQETPTRHVVIGHELGHVLIDGLRAEAATSGKGSRSVEGLYSRTVPAEQRPHFACGANEHLATELAVWALGIGRSGEIARFRSHILVSTLATRTWLTALDLNPGPNSVR